MLQNARHLFNPPFFKPHKPRFYEPESCRLSTGSTRNIDIRNRDAVARKTPKGM